MTAQYQKFQSKYHTQGVKPKRSPFMGKVKKSSLKKLPRQFDPAAVISLPENMIPVQTRSLNSIIFNGDSYGTIDKNFRSSRMLNANSTLNFEQ